MGNRSQGFTLIELLTTLAIAGVVISMAVPAFETLITRSRQQALLDQTWTAIQSTRAAAVMRKESVEICGTKDSATCNSDWVDGWLIRSTGSQQVFNVTRLRLGEQLQWKGLGKSVQFRSNGTTLNNGAFFQCHDTKVAWQLKLSRQGRLRKASAEENAGSTFCRDR
ncbi:GspH/FimT family pseudopilin [Stutzerimonas stutzeri]|jgi:type IV fimbrial biogenesis protein FimT|uniref:Type II secretion system protein H n=1 Tax=Stutzerimonas stutzeri TaxID=316 RepID=A0A0D9ARZ6_STUST|nr:hypothetical protein UF78_03785 [Stutzerimonas stutzeri]